MSNKNFLNTTKLRGVAKIWGDALAPNAPLRKFALWKAVREHVWQRFTRYDDRFMRKF